MDSATLAALLEGLSSLADIVLAEALGESVAAETPPPIRSCLANCTVADGIALLNSSISNELYTVGLTCSVSLEWIIASDLDGPAPPRAFPTVAQALPPRLLPGNELPSANEQMTRTELAHARMRSLESLSASGTIAHNHSLASRLLHAKATQAGEGIAAGHAKWDLVAATFNRVHDVQGDSLVYAGVYYDSGENVLGDDVELLGGTPVLVEMAQRLEDAVRALTPAVFIELIERLRGVGALSLDGPSLTMANVLVDAWAGVSLWNNLPPHLPPSPSPQPPSPSVPPGPSPPPLVPPPADDGSLSSTYLMVALATLLGVAILWGCLGLAIQRKWRQVLSHVRRAKSTPTSPSIAELDADAITDDLEPFSDEPPVNLAAIEADALRHVSPLPPAANDDEVLDTQSPPSIVGTRPSEEAESTHPVQGNPDSDGESDWIRATTHNRRAT